jgi:hypothetical protein
MMMAYIYCGDIYCDDCGKAIKARMREEMGAEDYREAKADGDSDQFPQFAPDGGGEGDSPQHCGNHADCLNAIELSDGLKIGMFLENDLTADGVEYVQSLIHENNAHARGNREVLDLWADFYGISVESNE